MSSRGRAEKSDDETICVTNADVSFAGYESLAVPICRASTIRFSSAEDYTRRFERGEDGYTYGLYGTPTHRFLESKITDLQGGARTVLTPSGQAAIAVAMLTLLETGDSVLLPDTIYPPARNFANNELRRLGIHASYYNPVDVDALEAQLEDRTRLIWMESPGSTTMEIQNVPRIVELAKSRGILTGFDNSWATPLLFKPLQFGVDIVVEALSKHVAGHSDVMMGSISARDNDVGIALKRVVGRMGIGVSPDDCALVLRGIETLAVRLQRSASVAMTLAKWIVDQPYVNQVLHPALTDCPGHDVWKRDFIGACGVFSVVLEDAANAYLPVAMDELQTFAIGASYGGTKSLLVPMSVRDYRTVKPWTESSVVLRLSVGLESEAALRNDLSAFFSVLVEQVCNKKVSIDSESAHG